MSDLKVGDWYRHDGGYPTFIERYIGGWWFLWNDSSTIWTPYARSTISVSGWSGFDEYHVKCDPPANAHELYKLIGVYVNPVGACNWAAAVAALEGETP